MQTAGLASSFWFLCCTGYVQLTWLRGSVRQVRPRTLACPLHSCLTPGQAGQSHSRPPSRQRQKLATVHVRSQNSTDEKKNEDEMERKTVVTIVKSECESFHLFFNKMCYNITASSFPISSLRLCPTPGISFKQSCDPIFQANFYPLSSLCNWSKTGGRAIPLLR